MYLLINFSKMISLVFSKNSYQAKSSTSIHFFPAIYASKNIVVPIKLSSTSNNHTNDNYNKIVENNIPILAIKYNMIGRLSNITDCRGCK